MENTLPLTRLNVSTHQDRESKVARSRATEADRTASLYPLIDLSDGLALQSSSIDPVRYSLESNYITEPSTNENMKAAAVDYDSPCSRLEDADNHDSAFNDIDNDPDCERDGSCNE